MSGPRLSMALVLGASALAVAIPAVAASPAGNQVPLVVPPSGGVAIQAVTLRVTGPGAGKVALPSRLELRGAALPRDATAMIALRTSRSKPATTITFLAVTVSRSTKASATPLPDVVLADANSGTYALGTAGSRKADTIWRASRSFAPAAGCPGCRVHASAIGLVDTGKAPPARGAAFTLALEKLLDSPDAWDPLARPDELGKGSSLRLYDAAHPAGRPISPTLASQGLQSAQQLLQGPAISVRDAVYEAFDETSACIAEDRRCGNYVFTFKGAKETTIRSDDANFRKTTTYSGRTCGRTLVGQPWKITSKSNNDPPVTRTIDFRKTREIFTDSATVDGYTGTAIHKLYPVPGAFPGMQAIVDSTGVWSSDLGGGVTVPVSVTKLPAGKRC